MRTIIFFFFTVVLIFNKSYAQTKPSDKELMDSLVRNDEMLKMLDNYDRPTSYFRVNVGLGNQLYSDADKSIEILQNNNRFIVSPSVSYNSKSGVGISFTGFLFNANSKTEFYQYSLSPFYNYIKGKNVNISLSYTHYFEKDKYSVYSSPVQNEFYGKILFKKNWLQPGISIGHSSGEYHEIVKIDTVIGVRQVHINYIDSVSTNLISFSITGSVEHSFEFYNLLSPKDGLIFTPQLSIVTGADTYNLKHSSTLANYNAYTKKALKRIRNFQTQSENNKKYQLQSLGLDLDVSYGIGKFYFGPELYLDYYLQKTNDKRITQIFNFNIGITF